MNKLSISPNIENYAIEVPNHVISREVTGGSLRNRRDFDEASFNINCQWTVNKSDYSTIVNFLYENAGINFLIDLILLKSEPTEYTVKLLPETDKLIGQSGDVYTLSATLEVLPDLSEITCEMELVKIETVYGNKYEIYNVIDGLEDIIKLFGNTSAFT